MLAPPPPLVEQTLCMEQFALLLPVSGSAFGCLQIAYLLILAKIPFSDLGLALLNAAPPSVAWRKIMTKVKPTW